ncbi:Rab-like protein [Acrasis kona]|uniref:Rab-like protein n=1 Tax=Acrasis kona TaxID=1008807 RepID=A0AAW2YQY2_9EUKA
MPEKDPIKVILLGDSAVGKSKLVERFLIDGFQNQQQSTYALNIISYVGKVGDEIENIDFWDTAGQERFFDVHPSYYYQAHACIFVFDTARKETYKNLEKWFQELQSHRKGIPCICVANKIDMDPSVTEKTFSFATNKEIPFYFVSAADGTNVVKVFKEAMALGKQCRDNPEKDFLSDVLDLLNDDTSNIE